MCRKDRTTYLAHTTSGSSFLSVSLHMSRKLFGFVYFASNKNNKSTCNNRSGIIRCYLDWSCNPQTYNTSWIFQDTFTAKYCYHYCFSAYTFLSFKYILLCTYKQTIFYGIIYDWGILKLDTWKQKLSIFQGFSETTSILVVSKILFQVK